MATFVLVHGGWHGGWCWQKVIPFLAAAGHEVYAPTLTGLAERASELSSEVGLDTHIQDIVGLLEEKNLHGVILVGHSYGGMVITGVVDQVPERIAHLVYKVRNQGRGDRSAPAAHQAKTDRGAPRRLHRGVRAA